MSKNLIRHPATIRTFGHPGGSFPAATVALTCRDQVKALSGQMVTSLDDELSAANAATGTLARWIISAGRPNSAPNVDSATALIAGPYARGARSGPFPGAMRELLYGAEPFRG